MLGYLIIGIIFIVAAWCVFIAFFVWVDDFTKLKLLEKEEQEGNDND